MKNIYLVIILIAIALYIFFTQSENIDTSNVSINENRINKDGEGVAEDFKLSEKEVGAKNEE